MTIDVEEIFHIELARNVVARRDWPAQPRRADHNVLNLLSLFARNDVQATFFFLGDVARAHPDLARRCADAGHEVASHGDQHDRLHRLTPQTFLNDLLTSKQRLEDQIGRAVHGYRAPTWSLTRDTAWAIDVLGEAGFTYDASIFPVRHPGYGIPDAPTHPSYLRVSNEDAATADGRVLLELPPLTWRVLGRNVAVAGGGWFRLLPLASTLMRRGLEQAARDGRPAILYFHPWEFDPQGPRPPLPTLRRLRTYTGLRRMERRLETLLRGAGPWRPIVDHLDALHELARQSAPVTLRPTGS